MRQGQSQFLFQLQGKLRRKRQVFTALCIFTLFSLGCNKPNNFLYVQNDKQQASPSRSVSKNLVDVAGSTTATGGPVDILWVIGGMTEQAANFANGVNSFMTSFASYPNWRMAVISDNIIEAPYLGMPTIFDFTDPNPARNFVDGVAGAVTGLDKEMLFDPVVQNLKLYPQFVRDNARLVIILTNDLYDNSTDYLTANSVMDYLASLKGGDLSQVVVYGVIGATDLNCDPATIDGDWQYHGSEIESLINGTGGLVYSLCDASFGTQLAKIGNAITTQTHYVLPWIHLDQKAKPASLHAFYKGNELPGGPQSAGGVWFFDIQRNGIVFYDLKFSNNLAGLITVNFDVATGLN